MFQEAPYARQQDRTELGDVAAGLPPLEQLRAQPVFQGADRLAHPGLRQMDIARRRADAVTEFRGPPWSNPLSGARGARNIRAAFIAKTYGSTRDFDRVRRGGRARVSAADTPDRREAATAHVGRYQGRAV